MMRLFTKKTSVTGLVVALATLALPSFVFAAGFTPAQYTAPSDPWSFVCVSPTDSVQEYVISQNVVDGGYVFPSIPWNNGTDTCADLQAVTVMSGWWNNTTVHGQFVFIEFNPSTVVVDPNVATQAQLVADPGFVANLGTFDMQSLVSGGSLTPLPSAVMIFSTIAGWTTGTAGALLGVAYMVLGIFIGTLVVLLIIRLVQGSSKKVLSRRL